MTRPTPTQQSHEPRARTRRGYATRAALAIATVSASGLAGCCLGGVPCDVQTSPAHCEGNVLHACRGAWPGPHVELYQYRDTTECAACYDHGNGDAECVEPPGTACDPAATRAVCDASGAVVRCHEIDLRSGPAHVLETLPCSPGNTCVERPEGAACAREGAPVEPCAAPGETRCGSEGALELCGEDRTWEHEIDCVANGDECRVVDGLAGCFGRTGLSGPAPDEP
jgi:hypothetical protein